VKLQKTLFLLPNAITLASICCGFDAIRLAADAQGDREFFRSALLVMFAALFDTLDGRVARATKTQSSFGLQIDSLADVVSFGLAPAFLAYRWSLHHLGDLGLFVAFGFAACGAIRLARFNVLSLRDAEKDAKAAELGGGTDAALARPPKYIVGLAIPGAAGVLVGLVMANASVAGPLGERRHAWVIALVTVALSALMVSTVRFRSFKDLRLEPRTFAFLALVVASCAAISAYSKPAFVVLWLLGGYVLVGLVESALVAARKVPRAIARRRRARPRPRG
jgi:CDP-diacylglycerol--serine O-phosphatidyltransferase